MPSPDSRLAQLLAGRPVYGTSGGNLMSMIGQVNSGQGQFDPNFSRYLTRGGNGDDGNSYYQGRNGSGIDEQGDIMRGGRAFVQLGGVPDDGRILDYSLVEYDPEFGLITPRENVHNPEALLDKLMPYIVAAGLGGAAFGAMGSAGEGAALSSGAGAEAAGTVSSLPAADTAAIDAFLNGGAEATANGVLANGGLGATAGTALPESYWGATADSGGIGTDAVVDGAALDPYAVDVTANSGLGAIPAADTAPAGAFDIGGSTGFGGTTPLETGIGDYISAGASNLVDGAIANPLGAARGALGLASVLAGTVGSHSAASGSSSPGSVADIINTMADANRVNQNTPFGSRTWGQDASGRWTATDAFSPQEQANYEGVRDMNGGVTNLAQQRLAALLATPAQSYSRPIRIGGRTLGG